MKKFARNLYNSLLTTCYKLEFQRINSIALYNDDKSVHYNTLCLNIKLYELYIAVLETLPEKWFV